MNTVGIIQFTFWEQSMITAPDIAIISCTTELVKYENANNLIHMFGIHNLNWNPPVKEKKPHCLISVLLWSVYFLFLSGPKLQLCSKILAFKGALIIFKLL